MTSMYSAAISTAAHSHAGHRRAWRLLDNLPSLRALCSRSPIDPGYQISSRGRPIKTT